MSAVLVYGVGEFVGKLALFLLLPVYGRFLSVAEFGVVALLFPLVQLLQGAAGLGLTVGLLKYYYDEKDRRGVVFVVDCRSADTWRGHQYANEPGENFDALTANAWRRFESILETSPTARLRAGNQQAPRLSDTNCGLTRG